MNWFRSKKAKNLIAQEKEIVKKLIEDKFGYYALQLGGSFADYLEQSRINKRLFNEGVLKNITFDSSSIPLADESVDLIICPHYIEQGYNEFLLEELFRTIIPGGHLIIISFNPFSFAGIKNFFSFDTEFPWNSSFMSMNNIQNKLEFVGFSITEAKISNYQFIYFEDKFIFNKNMENFGNRWLPLLGNIYFLVAQKKVISLTPIKPKWNSAKKTTVLSEE